MKLTKLAPVALGGLLLTGAMAGTGLAQTPPPAAPQAGPAGLGGPREMRRPDPAAMAARRAEHLRAALQLRPDQEPALKAYLDAARPAARPGNRPDRQQLAAMTTPQRLDAARARMTERLARFDQKAAATKRFYAQLTPAQQKAFDTLQPRGGHGGKGSMRGPGGGPGPMHRG